MRAKLQASVLVYTFLVLFLVCWVLNLVFCFLTDIRAVLLLETLFERFSARWFFCFSFFLCSTHFPFPQLVYGFVFGVSYLLQSLLLSWLLRASVLASYFHKQALQNLTFDEQQYLALLASWSWPIIVRSSSASDSLLLGKWRVLPGFKTEVGLKTWLFSGSRLSGKWFFS